jgi:hypothetical protein
VTSWAILFPQCYVTFFIFQFLKFYLSALPSFPLLHYQNTDCLFLFWFSSLLQSFCFLLLKCMFSHNICLLPGRVPTTRVLLHVVSCSFHSMINCRVHLQVHKAPLYLGVATQYFNVWVHHNLCCHSPMCGH